MTDDLENLLVQQGKAWRTEEPAAPNQAAFNTPDRTPTARPWLRPTIAAAVIGAVVIGTFAFLAQHETDRSTAPAGAPADATPCTAQQFVGAVTSTDRHDGYAVTLERVGAGACTIGHGDPNLRGFGADNTVRTAAVNDQLMDPVNPTVVKSDDLLVVPALICGTGLQRLQVDLPAPPDEDSDIHVVAWIKVSIPFVASTKCAANLTGTGPMAVIPAGTRTSLVRTITLPSKVRLGDPLRYQVQLTNPTDVAVPLRPCPGYQQALQERLLSGAQPTVTKTGQLDCASLPSALAPHSWVRLNMQFDTTGLTVGTRLLAWEWLDQTIDWSSEQSLLVQVYAP